MIRNFHELQTLDILARILDPGKEMKSKVSYFLSHVLKICKLLLTNPMMMYSSSMMDQLMDQKRDSMQWEALMPQFNWIETGMR